MAISFYPKSTILVAIKNGQKIFFYKANPYDKMPFSDGICLLIPPDAQSYVSFNNSRDQDFEGLTDDLGGSISRDWGMDAIGEIPWRTSDEDDILKGKGISYLLNAVNGQWVEESMEFLQKEAKVELRSIRPFPILAQNYLCHRLGREDAPCIVVHTGWDGTKVIIFFEIEGTLVPVVSRFLDGKGPYSPMLGLSLVTSKMQAGNADVFESYANAVSLDPLSKEFVEFFSTQSGSEVVNAYTTSLADQIKNTWNGAFNTLEGILELPPLSIEDIPVFFSGLLRHPSEGIGLLSSAFRKQMPKAQPLLDGYREYCEFDSHIMALNHFS